MTTIPKRRAQRAVRSTDVTASTPLLAHPLLHGVEGSRLGSILERITIREVRKGSLLGGPGLGQRLHLVLKGCVRAYNLTADGRELLLELLPEGNFDGLLSMSGRRAHFTVAHTDATVASLDLATLERMIALEPRIASNLLQLVIERLERHERHLETVIMNDPGRQLARQLLALGEMIGRREGDSIALDSRITHQMLADMLGVRRETVTLHLGHLTNLGAVEVHRGRFRLNAATLRRIVDGRGDSHSAA